MFDEHYDLATEALDHTIVRPFEDAVEVVDGLTELELREAAALRLGATVVEGMILTELIEWYNDCT